jgi:hypothetical protein
MLVLLPAARPRAGNAPVLFDPFTGPAGAVAAVAAVATVAASYGEWGVGARRLGGAADVDLDTKGSSNERSSTWRRTRA